VLELSPQPTQLCQFYRNNFNDRTRLVYAEPDGRTCLLNY